MPIPLQTRSAAPLTLIFLINNEWKNPQKTAPVIAYKSAPQRVSREARVAVSLMENVHVIKLLKSRLRNFCADQLFSSSLRGFSICAVAGKLQGVFQPGHYKMLVLYLNCNLDQKSR